MTDFNKLKKQWLKDPQVQQAYQQLQPQYEIAREVINARLSARLTQAQLAERMGTTQTAIARLESGKQMPSMKTLCKIGQAVGKTPRISFL